MTQTTQPNLLKQTRWLIGVFMIGLILSGATAFPIEWELKVANHWLEYTNLNNDIKGWIQLAYQGINETNLKYPFISYGTDWLAFAHLVIAVAFIGPWKDPVKNIWVIEFGLIACVAIAPLAVIAGHIRGIPFYWQIIDCSFGLFGGILLSICYRKIKVMQTGDSQPITSYKAP
jgi:hypothetical protein